MADYDQALDAHTDLMNSMTSPEGLEYLTQFVKSTASKFYVYEGSEAVAEEAQLDLGPDKDLDMETSINLMKGVISGLTRADPFWVDHEVVELIEVAAETFKPEAIYVDDLICDHAFVYMEKPFYIRDANDKRMGIRAFAWHRVWIENMQQEGLIISLYTHRDDVDDFFDEGEMFPLIGGSPLSIAHYTLIYFGDPRWLAHEANTMLAQHLQVFWRLTQQEIAIPGHVVPSRPTRRRRGKWKEVKNITVFTLRRARPKRIESEEERDVNWSHRWLVRGFWRQQWYPSLKDHRQIWISDFIKGPADRPFIAKKRVYDFRR